MNLPGHKLINLFDTFERLCGFNDWTSLKLLSDRVSAKFGRFRLLSATLIECQPLRELFFSRARGWIWRPASERNARWIKRTRGCKIKKAPWWSAHSSLVVGMSNHKHRRAHARPHRLRPAIVHCCTSRVVEKKRKRKKGKVTPGNYGEWPVYRDLTRVRNYVCHFKDNAAIYNK